VRSGHNHALLAKSKMIGSPRIAPVLELLSPEATWRLGLELRDKGRSATALCQLGASELRRGRAAAAREHFEEARALDSELFAAELGYGQAPSCDQGGWVDLVTQLPDLPSARSRDAGAGLARAGDAGAQGGDRLAVPVLGRRGKPGVGGAARPHLAARRPHHRSPRAVSPRRRASGGRSPRVRRAGRRGGARGGHRLRESGGAARRDPRRLDLRARVRPPRGARPDPYRAAAPRGALPTRLRDEIRVPLLPASQSPRAVRRRLYRLPAARYQLPSELRLDDEGALEAVLGFVEACAAESQS